MVVRERRLAAAWGFCSTGTCRSPPVSTPVRAVRSSVMPTRLPRWTWLLVLPMLVGALLLMHGLDAQAGESHHSATAASVSVVEAHPHDVSAPAEHGHCVDCLAGHVMAACVAIITAIGGIGLTRRLLTRGALAAPAAAVTDRVRCLVELARPPDPAWVRLSVMRC